VRVKTTVGYQAITTGNSDQQHMLNTTIDGHKSVLKKCGVSKLKYKTKEGIKLETDF